VTQGRGKALRALLLGGVLPIVAFTVIEEVYGVLWGLVAGMALGLGEIAWEWLRARKVEAFTWAGNGLILVMGGVSLVTQEGVWFKLQPALIEIVMGVVFLVSVMLKKPLLVSLMEKSLRAQGNAVQIENPVALQALRGMSVRVGIFFLLQAALATWAALAWSTAAWALLKGVGFTASMVLYMGAEALILRKNISRSQNHTNKV